MRENAIGTAVAVINAVTLLGTTRKHVVPMPNPAAPRAMPATVSSSEVRGPCLRPTTRRR